MSLRIASLVEGKAETASVPLLLRRIAQESSSYEVEVLRPIRLPRSRILKKEEFCRAVDLAARKAGPGGRFLVVLDADDGCPAEVGPELLEWASRSRADLLTAVVLAKREFEAWLLATLESLRGCRGIRPDATAPTDPEAIRDAKGGLSDAMRGSRRYKPVLDQPPLCQAMDLGVAESRSKSFAKFLREARRIVAPAREESPRR